MKGDTEGRGEFSLWRSACSHLVCSLQLLWPHQPQDIPTQSVQTLTSLSLHSSLPLSVYSVFIFLCLKPFLLTLCSSSSFFYLPSCSPPTTTQQKLKKKSTNLKVFPLFLLRIILWCQMSKTLSHFNLPLIFSLCVRSCGDSAMRFHSSCWGSCWFPHWYICQPHVPPASRRSNSCTQLGCVYVLLNESGWVFLYWILYVCICIPCMPLLRGIRATPYLRRSALNTRLIKLPRGVSWPCCPHGSLYICHNNNGHQALSHSIIVPLHYLQSILLKHWLSYAQRCHRVSMSSLMKLSLSWSIPLQPSQGRRAFSPQMWHPAMDPGSTDQPGCCHLGYGGCLIKNPIYLIIVQTNEVKESSFTMGTKKKTMVAVINHPSVLRLWQHWFCVAPWSPEAHTERGCRRIRAERHSAESSSAEDRLSNWRCETWTASLLSRLHIL